MRQPHIAEDLEAVRSRHKKRQTAIAQHANGIRKTIKCLKFKASNVELLKLLGRIGHEFLVIYSVNNIAASLARS